MDDKRWPDGDCAGKDLPDRGVSTGVTDSYGVGSQDLKRGYSGGSGIRKDTGSDQD
jgi:hypothetical protein